MSESKTNTGLIRNLVVLAGIVLALLMLFRVFDYLGTLGLPMGLISFLLCLGGAILLGSAGRQNYLASIFLLFIGLMLFADQVGWLTGDGLRWVGTLLLVLIGILIMISKPSPSSA